MQSIRGKNVVITGAASGMGRQLAILAAQRGANLALCDVDEAGLAETKARCELHGAKVFATRVDMGKKEAIDAFAVAVERELGPADVLVSNAGVSLSETIERMTDEDFHWLMNINFWGVVNGTRAFLPQLLTRPEGHVVTLSSVFGIIAVPTQSAYNASKFAVRGFTEALRQELEGTNVRVTCVHPGGIKTDIVKRGRHYSDPLGKKTSTEESAKRFEQIAGTTAERAAEIILDGILQSRPRVLIGPDAVAIDLMQRLFPVRYPTLMRTLSRLGERFQR